MAKPKKCKSKACCKLFVPAKPLQYVCNWQCAIAYANDLAEKNKQAEALKSRRETKQKLAKLKTRQEHLKDAQRFFNIWIRMRDGNHPCISCNRWHTGQYHAGHYRSVGSAPHLRFSELNCHRQCSVCNNHLSGNQIEYRKGLIAKHGVEKVEQLENDQEAKHYTIDDIIAIKKHYQAKVKELSQ
jgi:hypothetical protein